MRFQITTVAALVALSSALPTLKVRQAGPVLADTTYDAISISGGQAGDAEAEALAVFSALDTANPENIDEADLAFLGAVNDVANDAETDAFNPAIEAATGAEAEALEAGKTKNKVLKLMATKIELEAKQAQGEDVAAKLEEELTKLNNNIATDQENAGNPSTAVAFDATVSGGGNAAAAGNNNNANNGGNADNDDDAAADDDAGNNDAGNDDAANDDAANDDAANDDAGDNNQDQDAGNNNNNQDQDQDAGNNNNQDAGNNNNNQDQDQDQDAGNNNNANNNNNGGNNNAGNNNAGSGATGNFLFGGN